MGMKLLELYYWRTEGSSRAPKREVRFLAVLSTMGSTMWKAIFGKPADAIEKSVTKDDECKPAITYDSILLLKTFSQSCSLRMILQSQNSFRYHEI